MTESESADLQEEDRPVTAGTRVIQWATGPVGTAQLREIIDSPELELAGVLVYDERKAGLDAGDLVGRPPTGIRTTTDKVAIITGDADLVLHAAGKSGTDNSNTDDIVALLESGKDVVTTTSYNHLPTFGRSAHLRIAAACERGGSRFHAAGEHPGFMFERLAASLTALSQRVDRITVQEFVDCSGISERRMLVDLMGMGKDPGEITLESPMFAAVSAQYEQALGATADVLGLVLDDIRRDIATVTAPADVGTACATLPAGSVVGQILSWTGRSAGRDVLVAEEYWTVTGEIAGQTVADDELRIRIRVDGTPPMRLDLVIGNEPVAGLSGVSGGQLAVAMSAIRAVPDVRRAAPGIVVAPVFGAGKARNLIPYAIP